MFSAGELAFVVGSGTAGMRRSHFEDSDLCERAAPANVRSGWLGRHLATSSSVQGTFRAITIGTSTTLSLASNFETIAMSDIAAFNLNVWDGVRPAVMKRLEQMYSDIGGAAAASAGKTLDAIGELASVLAPAPGLRVLEVRAERSALRNGHAALRAALAAVDV